MADFLSPNRNQIIDENHSKFQVVVGESSGSRKPRGRPLGSKNKPKPPVIITRDNPAPSMQLMLLEISPNADILDAVFDLARRRRAGISVISAAGSVVNVSLRHPAVQSSGVVLSGRFDILSLGGTFLPNAASSRASPFTVSLAGAQGQVVGGVVAGPLVAAGKVVVTAAGFASPVFYRLPVRDQEEEEQTQAPKEEQEKGCGYAGDSGGEVVLWGTPAAAPRAPPPHSHRPSPPPAHY